MYSLTGFKVEFTRSRPRSEEFVLWVCCCFALICVVMFKKHTLSIDCCEYVHLGHTNSAIKKLAESWTVSAAPDQLGHENTRPIVNVTKRGQMSGRQTREKNIGKWLTLSKALDKWRKVALTPFQELTNFKFESNILEYLLTGTLVSNWTFDEGKSSQVVYLWEKILVKAVFYRPIPP